MAKKDGVFGCNSECDSLIGVHHRPELKRLQTHWQIMKTFRAIVRLPSCVAIETGQHDDFIVGVLTKWAQSKTSTRSGPHARLLLVSILLCQNYHHHPLSVVIYKTL